MSGNHNYITTRIPLPQALNIQVWREKLHDYHDAMLCDFLEFGWPLYYTSSTWPSPYMSNHPSADAYPDHIDAYLNTEMKHNSILGPFTDPPFSFLHTSPLMTRPKKNTNQRRVIMDLSYPPTMSVNSGIPKAVYQDLPYKLEYPSLDTFVAQILENGPGCHIF